MRFRYDNERCVLWAGRRCYPAHFRRESASDYIPKDSGFAYRMETRQALVRCENSWTLSTIWGDATYSSNRIGIHQPQAFIEEPEQVEVGLLTPDDNGLWGDPLSYVTVPDYHRLVECVSRMPSKDWPGCPDEDSEWSAESVCDYIDCLLMERRAT